MDYEKAKDYLRKSVEYVAKEFIPIDDQDPEFSIAQMLDEIIEERDDGITFEPDEKLIDEVNEDDDNDQSD